MPLFPRYLCCLLLGLLTLGKGRLTAAEDRPLTYTERPKKLPDYLSFTYQEAPISEIFEDLLLRYDLSFTFSPGEKLLACRISARSGLVTLEEGLSLLFAGTPIEYRIIRGQVAVRYSSRLAEALTVVEEAPPEEAEPAPKPTKKKPRKRVNTLFGKKPNASDEAVAATVVKPPPPPKRETPAPAPAIPREEATEVPWLSSPLTGKSRKIVSRGPARRQLMQVSVLPGFSSNRIEDKAINTISFNLPAGLSQGVVGAEIGLLFNGLRGDLEGVQISGGFNVVGNQLTGVQLAALGNGAGIGSGMQIAGVFNYCRRTLQGTQVSGLLNVALNGVERQYSAGLNVVQGDVRRQVGLVNRAVDVRGGQIGLVNVADTVAGRSFGLLNFVRKGYNFLEFGRTGITPYAFSLKLGSHRFYNVFELGGGRRELLDVEDGVQTEEDSREQIVWGVGYGFGWVNRLGKDKDAHITTEFVGTHLNRGGRWDNRLNFIASLRQTFDWRVSRNTQIYIGPALNFHFTKLSDDELDGLFVSGYRLWSRRYDKVAFRGFLGVRFGVRLGPGVRL